MATELRFNSKGEYLPFWYGRYYVNGRQKVVKLAVKVLKR